MDIKLLEVKERADKGDPKAIWQMAYSYAKGIGVPVIGEMVQYYFLKLAEHELEDESIPEVCFGTLYHAIAENYLEKGSIDKANEWFVKSVNYIKQRYVPDHAQGLIERLNLQQYLTQ